MSRHKKIAVTVVSSGERLVTEEVSFVNTSVRLYYNCQHKLLPLTSIQTSFFLYLTEKMNVATNEVYVDSALKKSFLAFINRISKWQVSMSTINKAVQKLSSMHMIVLASGATKSDYIVNPKYAVRCSEKRRSELLKSLIEERVAAGLPLGPFLNVPEEEFTS